ncbi:hypothetical protein L1049_024154 [Liquidambar formosana]|uniref:RRM domain-containing protein n=1 Tax=Liquidambar formosana TaxID=63359 RepID=A0AAP0S0A2_LIQFO
MQSPIVPGAGANWPDQHSAEGNLDLQGVPVQVSRPSDYNPSIAATLGPKQPNANLNLAAVELTGGLGGGDRIFVGGIPQNLTESQIRDLLEAFGPLWVFKLVRDIQTGNSKGYAYCFYQDVSATDIACAALNGMKIHHKTLTVRRLEPKPVQENELLRVQHQIALKRLMLPPGAVATKIVCVTHMVSADELKDDREYEGILEGMRQEGRKFAFCSPTFCY